MEACDLVSGLGRVQRTSAQLKEKWLATRTHWRDQAARDFEKNFLQELAPQISLVVGAVDEFAELMERAEKALADPDEWHE